MVAGRKKMIIPAMSPESQPKDRILKRLKTYIPG
jgi:hypothetical protein